MANAETETIILINMEDLENGYFRFSTSHYVDFKRLCKRIGGEENLIELKTDSQGSKVVQWNCKVPKQYLGRSNFSIRPPSTRKLTDEQKEAVRQRFLKNKKEAK